MNARLAILLLALSIAAGCGSPSRTVLPSDAPALDPDEVFAERGSAPDESWSMVGEFGRGRFMVSELMVGPGVADTMLDESFADPACPADRRVGVAIVPQGVHPELAWWLALAELHYQLPPAGDGAGGDVVGTLRHVRRTGSYALRDGGRGEERKAAERGLLTFRPKQGITCRAQIRSYAESDHAPTSYADRAAEEIGAAAPARMWAERFGLGSSAGGQTLWEQLPDEGGWRMRIHLAHEHTARSGDGERLDEALECRSSAPMRARELAAYRFAVSDLDGEGTRVCVWR